MGEHCPHKFGIFREGEAAPGGICPQQAEALPGMQRRAHRVGQAEFSRFSAAARRPQGLHDRCHADAQHPQVHAHRCIIVIRTARRIADPAIGPARQSVQLLQAGKPIAPAQADGPVHGAMRGKRLRQPEGHQRMLGRVALKGMGHGLGQGLAAIVIVRIGNDACPIAPLHAHQGGMRGALRLALDAHLHAAIVREALTDGPGMLRPRHDARPVAAQGEGLAQGELHDPLAVRAHRLQLLGPSEPGAAPTGQIGRAHV